MANFSDYLVAVFTGFVSGFLVSIPVGPINISIVNEGARRGFVWAFLIGLGATIMEVIYCAIAFAGFTHLLFDSRVVKATMELVSFMLMLLLGVTLGCFSWFTLLSFLVSRGHGRFSTTTLLRMSQFSGASLLIVSLVMG